MRTRWLTGLALLAAAVLIGGCNSKLKDENALLLQENEDLRAELTDRNAALESAHAELREKDRSMASLQREADSRSVTPADPFSGIPGVTGSVSAGEVTASVESDVLFDSGQASLKPAARRSLDAVARVLNSTYSGRPVRVSGHTDTDPIRKSGFKSNHHLGFERAFAVREYLISRGVSADRLYVASYGPDRARGSKKESRRVEIAVVMNDS